MSPEIMTAEKRRPWSAISEELDRLQGFDQNVYAEVLALLDRLNLLEGDNENCAPNWTIDTSLRGPTLRRRIKIR